MKPRRVWMTALLVVLAAAAAGLLVWGWRQGGLAVLQLRGLC